MNAKTIIDAIKEHYKFKSDTELEQFLDLKSKSLSNWKARDYINYKLVVEKIPDINVKWLYGLDENMFEINNISEPVLQNSYTHTDARFSENNTELDVTIIPAKAQLGLQSNFYADEIMADLPKTKILVDKEYKGKYYELECVGDSMYCSDPTMAILDGDKILCREVPKIYWRDKLHINKWEFVIFHNERGFLVKKIKEHDIDKGRLLLHSYNENKKLYPDFWINIKDCTTICNVVEIKRPKNR